MKRDALLEILETNAVKFQMTGSRYICNPAPTDTDEDYVALSGGPLADALQRSGFDMNTNAELYHGLPDFYAWRCGEFNVIETNNPVFFARFVAATEAAKAMNLRSKADRIAIFQAVLYGNIHNEKGALQWLAA